MNGNGSSGGPRHGRRQREGRGIRDGRPTLFEILGGCPPEVVIFKENCMNICQNFPIFQHLQNKVGKIRGDIGIWG